jgi:hypothetical protein
MEREMQEAQAAHEVRMAELELEPKFDIVDVHGNTLLAGVPKSMVRAVEADTLAEAIQQGKPARVVMPGSAEALGLERPAT